MCLKTFRMQGMPSNKKNIPQINYKKNDIKIMLLRIRMRLGLTFPITVTCEIKNLDKQRAGRVARRTAERVGAAGLA